MEKSHKQIQDVVSQIWDSFQIKILTEDKSTFKLMDEKVNFVFPEFLEIKPALAAPFMIISAPGAVGKTTFAKWAANQKKGYYWDLSKIKLGDNSFIGTLAKCFGAGNLARVLDEISKGGISFFIDAFDEAEIISGFDGIEKFISEIFSFCKESPRPNIVLFSRSETSSLLELLLDQLGAGNSIYSMYEIEYFNKENSIQFIINSLKSSSNEEEGGTYMFETHPEPFKRALDNIFKVIGKGIDSECQDIWSSDDIRSFIGYAPVLQTIASFLNEESNYEDVAAKFQEQSVEGGVKVIYDFIETLLEREQNKFLNGLKEKIGTSHPEFIDWISLYNKDKQIELLLQYIVNKRNFDPKAASEGVPDWMVKDFIESLGIFLPNHPFLKSGAYNSPAFRDYTLGKLITHPKYFHLARNLISSGNFVLTQLFSIFYTKFNGTISYGPDAGYLYESVSSRLSIDDNILLTYIKPNSNGTQKYTLEILNTEGTGYNNISLDCIIDSAYPLTFERRLYHATIDISDQIILGRQGGSIELSDVSINASKITILAKELIINCQSDTAVSLISEDFKSTDYSLSLKVLGNSFNVSFPGSTSYPWTRYHFEPPKEIEEIRDELYALKRILEPFRKHGKQDFGKYADFVDNRIVKGSHLREGLFKYLLKSGILSRKDVMYIMDESILNSQGINWSDLKCQVINHGIYKFLIGFKESVK